MIGLAWERLPQPRPKMSVEIYAPSGEKHFFYLGPHAPHLTPREVELLHTLWLKLSHEMNDQELHHHDIVHFALKEIERQIVEGKADTVLQRLRQYLSERRNKLDG